MTGRREAGVSVEPSRVTGRAPAIYGALLVTTLVAVQWQAEAVPVRIAGTLVISVAVFWIAHGWAEIISRRVRGPITLREAWAILVGEATMLLAVVVPGLVLATHVFAGVSTDLAIGLALAASLVQLFVWGLAAGRAAHDSWPVALGIGLVDFGFGLAIVVLKVIVLH
jgi:hypothetical protein